MSIQGIKLCKIITNTEIYYLILTFDGDLYYYNIEKNDIKLIDSDVTDFIRNVYISNDKCYRIDCSLKTNLIKQAESIFLSFSLARNNMIAITEENILEFNYLHGGNHEGTVANHRTTSNNKNILFYDNKLILQDTEGHLYHLPQFTVVPKKVNYPKVKEIFQDFVKLQNGDIVITNYHSYFINFNNICCKSNNLRESIRRDDYHLLLINNDLYSISGDLQEVICVYKNVKAIGRSSDIYDGNYIIF
jgi:hypothetical protein